MTECGFCGGPRLNGTPVKRDPETGEWRAFNGTVAPASLNTKYACRSCAKERQGLTTDPNHSF
ncbi:hypothetical protein HRTV-25_gp74 [Halorubrum tailed virus 25]|uniref:Uncharacterized protein n=1 Tax=Halorubrum tailed virus 25 TaxID=2878006 RepID=A0AAE8XY83_9CAUD|nr:hypothetical protein M1M37_gp074 [Halorubrum tailed virus 25]UBF22655.1 hypothetical protein HRTV-25_gp74 [Halorubrum tailed virus 25]